jgi:hypothetical protein
MSRPRHFDEVMIVNPEDPAMNYGYYAPGYGYYAAAPDEGFGWYGDPYGYYAQPELEGWDGWDGWGDGADAWAGWGGYADDGMEPVGYYADPYGYGDPYGYADPYGYGDPYGNGDPYGYGDDMDDLGDDEYGDDEFADYGADEDGVAAFVPDTPPGYGGLSDGEVEGYTPPRPVSPAVTGFTPGPAPSADVPDTLRPLW